MFSMCEIMVNYVATAFGRGLSRCFCGLSSLLLLLCVSLWTNLDSVK